MKKNTHSEDYRLVVFEDSSCNYSFLTRSTVKTDKTIKWEDGKEYPHFKIEISDKSHPYYTGPCIIRVRFIRNLYFEMRVFFSIFPLDSLICFYSRSS